MPRWSIPKRWLLLLTLVLRLLFETEHTIFAKTPEQSDLEQRFLRDVQPILKQHCNHCHSGEGAEAKFLTTQFDSAASTMTHWQSWDEAVRRIAEWEMPPQSEPPLSDSERNTLAKWSAEFQQHQAELHRGDPGAIQLRRLNAAEWNNSIRDLVGHDIRAAQDFPVDPANTAGFDNSAESLTMSPGLLDKYALSARFVAEHMLLTPTGVRFAPHPVVTDTDRDRYCVQRIVDFYHQQPTELVPYLIAARDWTNASQHDAPTLEKFALDAGLSPKYFALIISTLRDQTVKYGPLKEIQTRWVQLLNEQLQADEVKQGCEDIRRYIVGQRERLIPPVDNLRAPGGINGGSQPLVLWKNRQMAQNRRSCRRDGFTSDPNTSILSLELRDTFAGLPEEEQVKILRDYEIFCSIFPDKFYVSERGRSHIDPKEAAREAKGRLLSAGFHSMMGFFRDDQPLYDLMLSSAQQQELDRLWDELDFIAQVPVRQYAGHLWFERAEASFLNDPRFDFVRAEDKDAANSEMIRKFASVYTDKLREKNAAGVVIESVEQYFGEMDGRLRKLESDLEQSEEKQLESLLSLLEPIYRRPVTERDRSTVRDYYHAVRSQASSDHRAAMEDTLVFMLLSPEHLYRFDLATESSTPVKLSPPALASRWSYFLWASSPDSTLRQAAESGILENSADMRQQFQRIINDPRFEGMAKEFLGNWLEFRRFETHTGVDRNEFPQFDDELRQAMFAEPIQYFMDLVRRDGKLTSLIDSDYVIVNKTLAKHYGLKNRYERQQDTWQRIENVAEAQRGGLIPMAVFLTQNSPGLRTSPVKRGYWVVRKILGEKIPAPPPNVPELPDSEHDLGDLTLREILEKHREHPSCASCHARFDAFGLLLEGFDPIGRPRQKDLAGHAVSAAAILPDGSQAEGMMGLNHYIMTQRANDFRRNFCEKLVAFALGRSLILSDRLLVDDMLAALEQQDDRIQAAFLVLLQSPQFRMKRSPVMDQEKINVTQ